jgi:type IV secretory pathway protease TraF
VLTLIVNELIVVLFVYLCVFVITLSRVRANVGVSVQLGLWKVLTSLPPGSLYLFWKFIRTKPFALHIEPC